MFRKEIFILAHQCGDMSFYPSYKKLVKNQWTPYDKLKHDQEKQLKNLIKFSYENVPYYHNLFRSLGLSPEDIQTIEDLEKLPILTKDIIKKHWEEFKPVNLSSMKYYNHATGGSTGTPMQYRLSKHDRFLGGALLYRGWGYGGYELGDRMVFLAGSSLGFDTKSKLTTFIHETTRNLRKLPSFGMGRTKCVNMHRLSTPLNLSSSEDTLPPSISLRDGWRRTSSQFPLKKPCLRRPRNSFLTCGRPSKMSLIAMCMTIMA